MRMWMVDPRVMCREHLLGEHRELHTIVGTLRKGIRIDGYIRNNLIEVGSLDTRHAALVREMDARGYNHRSELVVPSLESYPERVLSYRIDRESSLADLLSRCLKCRARFAYR